jgi:hypothetical protein
MRAARELAAGKPVPLTDEEARVASALENALSDAVNKVMAITPPPQRPLVHLVEVLQATCAADSDGDGLVSEAERVAHANHELEARDSGLGKAATGIATSTFLSQTAVAATSASPADLPATDCKQKKKVLFVIDCQDGYDGSFVSSLPPDSPGGLAYIQSAHDVRASYELGTKKLVQRFAAGEKKLRFDKVWNRGLDGVSFEKVCARVVEELRSGAYDHVVFTYDYLERADGEEKGVFALDSTPWKDPTKPVAFVPYSRYLTINAGGLGTNISRNIRKALPEVTHARGAEGNDVCGTPALYFRKQVDDAFDDGTEQSARTLEQPWLDNVDVDDEGLPKPKAETLLRKLERLGLGPNEAVGTFCGVVTNRCVASSLLHAVQHGYEARLLEGGCMAASDEEHAQGLALIKEKGGAMVEMVP